MKKLLLLALLLFGVGASAQSDYYTVITGAGTSPNGRAPQGSSRYNRSVWLITAAEMSAAGFTSGSIVNSLGFNLSIAQNVATTGNFTVYLQNTADVTNLKSTAWATAITGMTVASNSTLTIPSAVGTFDTTFTGGTSFTYTGGGLYIAFDYQNALGTIATTGNTSLCNTLLTNGVKSAFSTTAAPTTLVASNFRPVTRLGIEVLCARPDAITAGNFTLNSADLSWISDGTVDVEYGPYNFVQGSGTTITNIATAPYILTGLIPSTAYDYYTRKNCGSGNYSTWNGPFAFHTIFQAAIPTYNTSFEVEAFPLIGWLADTEANGSNWLSYFGGSGNILVQNGSYSAVSISNATAIASGRLYSRGVSLQAGATAIITYYVRNYVSTSTNAASYKLTVGSAQTTTAQTTILATETGITSTAFVQKTYNFTPTTTGVYYFSFLNNSPVNAAGTHAFILDNFTVTQNLATDEFLSSKFSVSPNPATDFVNISEKENTAITSVTVTDLNGRIVKQITFDNQRNVQVNIADLSSGIYMMNITSKESSATKKIVKN